MNDFAPVFFLGFVQINGNDPIARGVVVRLKVKCAADVAEQRELVLEVANQID